MLWYCDLIYIKNYVYSYTMMWIINNSMCGYLFYKIMQLWKAYIWLYIITYMLYNNDDASIVLRFSMFFRFVLYSSLIIVWCDT